MLQSPAATAQPAAVLADPAGALLRLLAQADQRIARNDGLDAATVQRSRLRADALRADALLAGA